MSAPRGRRSLDARSRREARGRRRSPRRLATALERLTPGLAPATTLAAIQELWAQAAGPAIAAASRPVAEHDGVLTVSCDAAVWAAELELLGPEIADRLNARLGAGAVTVLRCRTG